MEKKMNENKVLMEILNRFAHTPHLNSNIDDDICSVCGLRCDSPIHDVKYHNNREAYQICALHDDDKRLSDLKGEISRLCIENCNKDMEIYKLNKETENIKVEESVSKSSGFLRSGIIGMLKRAIAVLDKEELKKKD